VRKIVITVLVAAGLLFGSAAAAFADASAPTSGGNGAGQSGQCTGQPADRPAVCPATWPRPGWPGTRTMARRNDSSG
jgi:hypothetical protein